VLVKCVATLGPSIEKLDVLKEVSKYVDGFRINFSHGDEEQWWKFLESVRKLEDTKFFPVIGDLQGPSIRFGEINKLQLEIGETIEIGLDSEVNIPHIEFFSTVSKGDVILTDDGKAVLKVIDKRGFKVTVKALTPAVLKPGKGVVVQGKDCPTGFITEKDKKALKFLVEAGLEYVALSYIRGANEVLKIRNMLKGLGGADVKVISKIETRQAVENLDEIISVSDYILVARGDLGLHFTIEEVPMIQDNIVEKAVIEGKPVMVATQILDSMVDNPIPTRAEAVDIYSAVKMGVDSLLLTEETAIGKYPTEAVKWLKRISEKSEKSLEISRDKITVRDIKDSFIKSLVEMAENLNAKIVIYTKSGLTAERISKYKPLIPVYAASGNLKAVRKLGLYRGIISLLIQAGGYEEGLEKALNFLKNEKELKQGDVALLTYGLSDRPLHYIKLVTI